jgi:hypothetical protein
MGQQIETESQRQTKKEITMAQGHIIQEERQKQQDGTLETITIVRDKELAELIKVLVMDCYRLETKVQQHGALLHIVTDRLMSLRELYQIKAFTNGIQNCHIAMSDSIVLTRA